VAGVRLHKRTQLVEAVRCLLGQTHDLTRLQLREERHSGEPERKADEA
jgi:hypothetical protein